ncbi:uncharacterized protein LOC110037251 [Phalaenopsis equestris]|uniref:uncharacterized protein LOC110037251 n=1 Tax=Phalaenopsis equestris TaxID=78828 RepID=UPI0009E5E112|nr:uncharacterized protein LOC110037251 [Phalaenopsis equestris]
MERFQHSSETINRYFSVCLNSLVSLAQKVVKPEDPTFNSIPLQIANDPRYMSFFKFATRNLRHGFPYPPPGKYYLVDVAYPLQRGYLKPDPDTKYHIPDFERSSGVTRGKKEVFNKRHSSLHGVIERAFGLWKKKWVILRDMPSYPFPKQVQIVVGTMALHNFIRRHPSRSDAEFVILEDDSVQIPHEAFEYHLGRPMPEKFASEDACTREGEGASEMTSLREQIAEDILRS